MTRYQKTVIGLIILLVLLGGLAEGLHRLNLITFGVEQGIMTFLVVILVLLLLCALAASFAPPKDSNRGGGRWR